MKDYAAKGIRNFAIAGHGGSGKTMLAEAMLSKSGEINRLGSIESAVLFLTIIKMSMTGKFQSIHLLSI